MRNINSLLFLICFLLPGAAMAASNVLDEALAKLPSSDFDEKAQAITLLVQSGHEKTERLLNAILDGDLYYLKKNKAIVFVQEQESGLQLNDALTGADLGVVSSRKVKKVTINNRLRKQLKLEISTLQLSHPDPANRQIAVESLIGKADQDAVDLLTKIKQTETDAKVIETIDIVIAFTALDAESVDRQLQSIALLDGHLNPLVLNKLKAVSMDAEQKQVRVAALKAVQKIEQRVSIFGYIETLFFGLSLGSILALAAIGLAITFGVMGVINMAHGELIMIGAYTTYVVQLLMPEHIGASILVSIPAAFMVSALVGIAIERGVIRFLYGRPLETLLATFGISLVLQQAIRSIFSPLNRSVETPEWMSGSMQINSLLSITYNRLYIFFFCLIVFALLYLVMKKTSLGLHVRAVSQNRAMARAMGIRSQWVDAMTFGLGSGIAGVAGVALSQITNVGPNLGQAYIVDSFMVVVFGGVGNLFGTLISGLSLGVVGKFLEPVTGAVLSKILVLIFIILFIQKRPRGLFPQKGRAADQ